MSNAWDGNYLFTFQPWVKYGGNWDALTADAKALGLTGLLLKFANGSLAGDPVSQRFMDTFKQIAPKLIAAGLSPAGWIYQYLTDIEGEVDACVQAVEAGAAYIILDAEVEIANKTDQVRQFGQLLRQKMPNAKVGLSSFPIVSYHRDIPWGAYMEFVDFIAPQIYWADMGMPVLQAFNQTLQENAGFGKPIVPTGQAWPNATAADIANFVSLCKAQGFTGISWWDLDSAAPEHLAAIGANKIMPQNTIAPDVADDSWYADAVKYVLARGFMSGDEGTGNFNPDAPVTRAMLAKVIYNLTHQPR